MPETVVVTDPQDDGTEESEHAAAVAEGAAEVHAENAQDAAAEAAESAEEAAGISTLTLGVAEAAEDAAARAESAYQDVATLAAAFTTATERQTAVLQSLAEGLQQQQSAPVVEEKPKPKPDRPPAPAKKRKGGWYWGK